MESNLATTRPAARAIKLWSVPRFLDSVALLLALSAAAGLWFYLWVPISWAAFSLTGLFALFAGAGIASWQIKRRDRFMGELKKTAYRLWLSARILKTSKKDFEHFVLDILHSQMKYRYQPTLDDATFVRDEKGNLVLLLALKRHPGIPVNAQNMMEIIDDIRRLRAKRAIIAVPSTFDALAIETTKRADDLSLRCIDMGDLCAMASDNHYAVPPQELDSYIVAAKAEYRKIAKTKVSAFATWRRPMRFLYSSAVLAVLSWLTPYKLWYLTIASFCLAVAIAQIIVGHAQTKKASASS